MRPAPSPHGPGDPSLPSGIYRGESIETRIENRRDPRALRILGIDPGSQVTGYGVVEQIGGRLVHVAHGTIRPPRGGSLASRLHRLHEVLLGVIALHHPDVASVEQVFVASSPRAALVLGQARGAALVALGEAGVALREYAPAQIKQTVTGSGRAAKSQMQQMVRRLLALDRAPAVDAADALAAAICHAHVGRLDGLVAPRRTRRSRVQVRTALRTRRAP
jgi:crossover junction endodeoxyribonuclease RuvC